MTIVSANLHMDNGNLAALREWASRIDADLLVLQEVTHGSAKSLTKWHEYPHQVMTPDESPFGMAILSRLPIDDSEALETSEQPVRYRLRLRWGEAQFALSAVHPMPPISALYHERRTALLAEEAQWLASRSAPGILAGDFNASPWSVAMRELESRGLLLGGGARPTWPAVLPVIPIDHMALTSSDWTLVRHGVGPDVGSDHRPAYIILRLTLGKAR